MKPLPKLFSDTALSGLVLFAACLCLPCVRAASVEVGPYDEKRVPMSIQGPCTENLVISPKPGYKLVDSDISMQDGVGDSTLWHNIEKNPGGHTYQIAYAYSSQEFVHIDGTVTKPAPGSGGKGEPPPFHVTVPAVDIDWKGYTAWSDEPNEDTNTLWVTDQTNQTFYVNPPREIADDMPKFTNDEEDEDWVPNLRLHWDATKINVYTNDILIRSDFTIPRSRWLVSGNPEAMEFKASRNTNSVPTGEVLDIRLDRMSTTGDVNFSSGETSGTYDVIKCKTLLVDLDIDTTNAVGIGVPHRTQWEDDNEEKTGKIIHMNDMDMDGDFIPDFLDGFKAITDVVPDDNENENDAVIEEGASFAQLILECNPRPANAKIKFVYNCPNDPRNTGITTLALAALAGTNSASANPLGVGIRIWNKAASESRTPESVEDGGNFVPPGVLISQDKFAWSGNKATLYVEGIGTTGNGLPTIQSLVYPDGGDGEAFPDKVSYSVVRCVYRVCAYRPYTCEKNFLGIVTNRFVFNTRYSSPRTMFTDYGFGVVRPDTKYHEQAAFMGHGFARIEVRMPDRDEIIWTGQTGMNGKKDVWSAYQSLRAGDAYWQAYDDGKQNDDKDLEPLWNYFVEVKPGYILTDGSGPKKKLVASVELRVLPLTMAHLLSYRETMHDFTQYGLDTTITTPSNRCGCASYTGLLTQYAKLPGYSAWTVDVMMPVVPLSTIPSTLLGVAWEGKVDVINQAVDEFCHPTNTVTEAWGRGSARSLKFDDPAKLAVWIDDQNNSAPVNGDDRNHQKVILLNNVPETDSLIDWRR